jgi:polyphosphate kinase
VPSARAYLHCSSLTRPKALAALLLAPFMLQKQMVQALKRRVLREGLLPYLKDNADAWELGSDGHYRRRKPRGKSTRYSAQEWLLGMLGEASTPGGKEVREADGIPALKR